MRVIDVLEVAVDGDTELTLADPRLLGVEPGETGVELLVDVDDGEPDVVWQVRTVTAPGEVPPEEYRLRGRAGRVLVYVLAESVRHRTLTAAYAEAKRRGCPVEEVLGIAAEKVAP